MNARYRCCRRAICSGASGFSQTDHGAGGVWVWIGVEDDSLFQLYKSKGVKVRQEPRNFPWAYEMKFEDLDGNVLWMGTEARKDMPLEGRGGLAEDE